MRNRIPSPAWALLFCGLATAPALATPPVVTAITEVKGDGQTVTAVALEYSTTVETTPLQTTDFSVEGATITRVYAQTSAARAPQGVDGRFVILELAHTLQAPRMGPPPGGPRPSAPPGGGGPRLGDQAQDSATAPPLGAQVSQLRSLATVDGPALAPGGPWKSTKTVNLVVDDFRQGVYTDPRFPQEPLAYNLYVPKAYSPQRKYPLVVFLHDSSAVSHNPTKTLTQGLGAVAFATPEAQAKNPAFVLAPQYDRVIADDASHTTDQLAITVDLIHSLTAQYSIDTDRLYNTGQSMGGMASIALDIQEPSLFAASLLVACQWDPTLVAPLATKPLWFVVSQGDSKALPGQAALLAALKAQGAKVAQATWSAEASAAEIEKNVAALAHQDASIHQTIYQGGSHPYTWLYAYSTDGFREWLFAQAKTDGSSARQLVGRALALSQAGDAVGALPFLEKAAALGDVRATEMLGEAWSSGQGLAVDGAKAAGYFQKAIALGSARSMTNLGILYLNGTGVPASRPTALGWFEKATAAGDMKGPRWAGELYLQGTTGVPADPAKAREAFTLAADRGDVTANYYLGTLWEQGLGVPQDFAKAAAFYTKAAPPTGHAEGAACFALGRLWEHGLGVAADRAQALAWYQRGAALGDADAQAAVKRLTGS